MNEKKRYEAPTIVVIHVDTESKIRGRSKDKEPTIGFEWAKELAQESGVINSSKRILWY